MVDNHERLTSLNSAAGLCVLRRSLSSSGTASIIWALIWFCIAGIRVAGHDVNTSVVLFAGFAIALLGEGIYVLRSRSRSALTAEAVTLALLAALNLYGFGYSLYAHSTGRPPNPLFGLIMAFNAWQTWTARNAYTAFSESTTEADIEQVKSVIKMALSADCKMNPNVVQLKQRGMSVKDPQWRIWIDSGLIYLINVHSFFRWTSPAKVVVCNLSSLSLEVKGEKWLGKSQKLKLIFDGVAADNSYEISPEMLEKLGAITGVAVG
jgi:hypothetical protein